MAFSSPVLWGLARGRGIRNDNPDKGTEINSDHSNVFIKGIRNDNPDKGTEMRGQIRGTL